MTTLMRWWFVAFVVVVFVAGTSVGIIIDRVWLIGRPVPTRTVIVAEPARGAPLWLVDEIIEINLRRLRNRLELTSAQDERVRPILEAWQGRMEALQAGTREQLTAEMRALQEELSPVLTEQQRARLSTAPGVLVMPAPGRGRRGDEGRAGVGLGRSGPGRIGGDGRE